jgi:uncharacterized membrane protein (UPF0127 family)
VEMVDNFNIFQWKINEKIINLKIADSIEKIEKGLSKINYLDENEGMIFLMKKIFKDNHIKFWMKDTLIPLDMIFIKNNKVVLIEKNCQPCLDENYILYGPDELYDMTIEINAGQSDKLNLKINDEIIGHYL